MNASPSTAVVQCFPSVHVIHVVVNGEVIGSIRRDPSLKRFQFFPGTGNTVAFVYEHTDLDALIDLCTTHCWQDELATHWRRGGAERETRELALFTASGPDVSRELAVQMLLGLPGDPAKFSAVDPRWDELAFARQPEAPQTLVS